MPSTAFEDSISEKLTLCHPEKYQSEDWVTANRSSEDRHDNLKGRYQTASPIAANPKSTPKLLETILHPAIAQNPEERRSYWTHEEKQGITKGGTTGKQGRQSGNALARIPHWTAENRLRTSSGSRSSLFLSWADMQWGILAHYQVISTLSVQGWGA